MFNEKPTSAVQKIQESLCELETLGQLRSRLDRCPTGNARTNLTRMIDNLIDPQSPSSDCVGSVGQLSFFKSRVLEDCVLIRNNDTSYLIRIVGDSLEISLDVKTPNWIHACKLKT